MKMAIGFARIIATALTVAVMCAVAMNAVAADAFPPPCDPTPVKKNVRVTRREITVAIIGSPRPSSPNPTVEGCFAYWKAQIDREIHNRPDLIVLPEGVDSWVGMKDANKRDWVKRRGDRLLKLFQSYAKEHAAYLVFNSYRQHRQGGQSNTSYLIDREGDVVAVYDKVYPTPGEIEWPAFPITPGDRPVVADTDFGRVGFATCFDLNFRDLIEAYRQEQPDVICFCSAYNGDFWQRVWSYTCRCHLIAATTGNLAKDVTGPSGESLYHLHDYFQTCTVKINTNCRVCHLDDNWGALKAAERKYGQRVEVRKSGAVGTVTVISHDPSLPVDDVIREFGLILWDDYYNRSVRLRGGEMGRGALRRTAIPLLKDEHWWGAAVNLGEAGQPWSAESETRDLKYRAHDFDLSCRCWGGGVMPFLVSDKGRYVWGKGPFSFRFSKGMLHVSSRTEQVEAVTAGNTLKSAYLAGASHNFPFNGKTPPEEFFTKPQYNNWIEMFLRGVAQTNCEAIVDELAASQLPVGVFMTDGGWMKYHGAELFDATRYPNPVAYFDRIRSHGWKSLLWMSHFVSPDSQREYRKLRYYPHAGLPGSGYEKGLDYLVHVKNGKDAALVRWWSGISASYDLTHPDAFEYYVARLKKFAADYHFDGFKFDAGNAEYFAGDHRLHEPWMPPCEFGRAYTMVGTRIPYNEFRSGYGTGGREIVQRLHDQPHTWAAQPNIVRNMITAGLIGYPYTVADMIGGGLCGSFFPGKPFSPELMVRNCELQALMPMMQFSLAPWRVLNKEQFAICLKYARLHCEFGPYIMKLARHAAKTGEPILRAMEYEFPGEGFGTCFTQFMLGPDWLVAPVLSPDNRVSVRLPRGAWEDDLGARHTGPATLELTNVPLDRLPRYRRISTPGTSQSDPAPRKERGSQP